MTMCIVDDDAKRFEVHFVTRRRGLLGRASVAVTEGRNVCCYVLRGGADEIEREERFLASRGYTRGRVEL